MTYPITQILNGEPTKDSAEVFGWIYAVIFETSVVKVGMSKVSPEGRIAVHRHAGAKFGVKILRSYSIEIFTKNAAELESELIKKANAVAELIAGREWFQFDTTCHAIEFCEAQVVPLRIRSYLDRPSVDQLDRDERRSKALLSASFTFANLTNDESAYFNAGCEFANYLQELAQDAFHSASFFQPLADFPNQSLFTLICGAYIARITERDRVALFEVLDAALDEDSFTPYLDFFDKSVAHVCQMEVVA